MSRTARLHVPGGLYYVVQRGNASQPIFAGAGDYGEFERLLAVLLARCRMRAHAFCWTPHSFHLAVEISDIPLGRLMQRLTSQYVCKMHRRKGESGRLFQQRYQSLLVDPERYLVKLVRHVHRVAGDTEYRFTSHRAYLGEVTLPWLTTHLALRMLGQRNGEAREAYGQLMREEASDDEPDFERGGGDDPRVLGTRQLMPVAPRRLPACRSSRSLEQVIDTVSHTLAVERAEVLSRSRQRRLALARALIAWYATERGIATLAEVAQRLERHPSTLFVAVERYRSLRPELFTVTALTDSGPLLRLVQ